MSVTTTARINPDKLQAALPAGASYSSLGVPLDEAGSKTIRANGADDATLQAAIASAASAFVDYDGADATLRQQAQQALGANRTYIGLASPTAAQTAAQVKALSRQNNALIRLLLGLLDGTD